MGLTLLTNVCLSDSVLNFVVVSFAVEYAQIDWHDFVLVETIDFRESETGTENVVG